MRRSTVRFFAAFILVLLGAPVAMHVILLDLRGAHEAPGMVSLEQALESRR